MRAERLEVESQWARNGNLAEAEMRGREDPADHDPSVRPVVGDSAHLGVDAVNVRVHRRRLAISRTGVGCNAMLSGVDGIDGAVIDTKSTRWPPAAPSSNS